MLAHSHHNTKYEGELQDMGMTWARAGCCVLVHDSIIDKLTDLGHYLVVDVFNGRHTVRLGLRREFTRVVEP